MSYDLGITVLVPNLPRSYVDNNGTARDTKKIVCTMCYLLTALQPTRLQCNPEGRGKTWKTVAEKLGSQKPVA